MTARGALGINLGKSKKYGPETCNLQLNILKKSNQILHILETLGTEEIVPAISQCHATDECWKFYETDYNMCGYYANKLKLCHHTLEWMYIKDIYLLFNCFIIAS